jgi:hypothetical protein
MSLKPCSSDGDNLKHIHTRTKAITIYGEELHRRRIVVSVEGDSN